MKHLLALTALIFGATTIAHADILGDWQTEEGESGGYAIVNIAPCGDNSGDICGVITDIIDNENRSAVGTAIIKGMEDRGNGRYRGGQIYAPDQERWYNSRMNLEDDGSLEVYGCVAGGLICRGQTWMPL